MRLWHWQLLPFLPRSQLLAQWRELNSVYAKEDQHVLINYIYEYPKSELYLYSQYVIEEMQRRAYQIRSWDKYQHYFEGVLQDACELQKRPVFVHHHNGLYLEICYFNLYEKHWRGQKDYPVALFEALNAFYQSQK